MHLPCLFRILLILAAVCGAVVGRAETLEPGDAARIVNLPEVGALRADLLANHARPGAIVTSLRRIAADSSLPVVAREHLLREGVMALSQIQPTARVRAFVEALKTREPAVYVWLSEAHYRTSVPLYDVGAAARFATRNWARTAAKAETQDALARGTTEYMRFFSGEADGDAQRAGVIDAFEAATLDQLRAQRAAVSAALETNRSSGALALVVARRLADEALFLSLAHTAEASLAVRMASQVPGYLDQDAAQDVLEALAARPETASAALLTMGTLAPVSSRAYTYLLQALGHTGHGGSAAVALSRLQDPGTVLALDDVLSSERSEQAKRRAVLALRLHGTPAARAVLQRFAVAPAASPSLRREISRWLQD